MELKNSNNSIILDDLAKPIYRGGASLIYRHNGELVKVFHVADDKSISTLSEDNFDLIKKIKHKNFIDLIDRYHRVPETSEFVEAYTYHEIEGSTFNFLQCDTEFCVEQLRILLSLFDIFSECGIKMQDVSAVNTLVLSDRIVLIDPDLYDNVGLSTYLKGFNRNQLIYLVLSYFFYYDGYIIPEIIEGCIDSEDPVELIAKRLLPYKTPIDYIRDLH